MITTKPATRHFTRVGFLALVLATLLFGALSFQQTRQAHAATLAPMQHMQYMQPQAGGPKSPQEPTDRQCLLIYSGYMTFQYYDPGAFNGEGAYVWGTHYSIKNNCGEPVHILKAYMDISSYCNGAVHSNFDSWQVTWLIIPGETMNTTRYGETACLEPGTYTDPPPDPAPVSIYTYTWMQGLDYSANTCVSNGWNANLSLRPPY
jgi:hypothetical protein